MAAFRTKAYLPRSLYGRSALILLVPILTIQIGVGAVLIQRLYADVTRQITGNVGSEVAYLADIAEAAPTRAAALAAVDGAAPRLGLARIPGPGPRGAVIGPLDLSGRTVVPTLTAAVPGLLGVDLTGTSGLSVEVAVDTRHGPIALGFGRSKVSARNPHQLLVIMGFLTAVMTTISYLFLKNQVRPIASLAQAAEAFGRGRTIPYRPSGATEVRMAGSAFLDMRQRIERYLEQRTLMLSGVSHDLRTPLTRLRLGLAMSDDPGAADMVRDVGEMEAMIEAFLGYARDDAGDAAVSADPMAIVDDVVVAGGRAGHDVTHGEISGTGPVTLRPLAVRRALDNLVGNAVRYGGRATVGVVVTERAVRFRVEDDGPGMPAADRAEAMRPFVRLDAARNQDRGSGVGLGLAIAADIARQHGGSLRLGESEDLGGLRADLVLAR